MVVVADGIVDFSTVMLLVMTRQTHVRRHLCRWVSSSLVHVHILSAGCLAKVPLNETLDNQRTESLDHQWTESQDHQ